MEGQCVSRAFSVPAAFFKTFVTITLSLKYPLDKQMIFDIILSIYWINIYQ